MKAFDLPLEAPRCEIPEIHTEVASRVRGMLPAEDSLFDLAELFKIFGDSTRVKILYVLFEEETCVCDVAEALNMTVSAISHQLRILKNAKLVKFRRDGKRVLYALDDDHVRRILALGLEHVTE